MSDNISGVETVYKSSGASVDVELNLNELFDGRYMITERLGAGGMGTAYLASDQLTDEEVVIKVIHPSLMDEESKQRMIAEGVNARKIKHPNVVSVHDVKEVDGQVYLTMEHVKGKSLRNWMAATMASGSNAPVDHVLKIIREILAGLAAAHDAGVIHRDLKPENVMLEGTPGDGDFRIKIIDFGIATGLKAPGTTTSKGAIGAPLYMAPEQMTMPDSVGPSADIYSVGRMFYEMLMDVLPDGMWNPPSATRSDVPQELDQVIQKALQPPRSRYSSATEFSTAISQCMSGELHPERPVEGDEKKSGPSLVDFFKPGKLDFNNKKTRIWAVVIAFIVIGSVLYEDYTSLDDTIYNGPNNSGFNSDFSIDNTAQDLVDDFVDDVAPPPPEVQVKQAVTPASSSQAWRGGDGSIFDMTVTNGVVSGSGFLQPWGRVSLRGDPGSYVDVYNYQNQNVAALSGNMVPSNSAPGVWDYTGSILVNGQVVGGFIFHIDH